MGGRKSRNATETEGGKESVHEKSQQSQKSQKSDKLPLGPIDPTPQPHPHSVPKIASKQKSTITEAQRGSKKDSSSETAADIQSSPMTSKCLDGSHLSNNQYGTHRVVPRDALGENSSRTKTLPDEPVDTPTRPRIHRIQKYVNSKATRRVTRLGSAHPTSEADPDSRDNRQASRNASTHRTTARQVAAQVQARTLTRARRISRVVKSFNTEKLGSGEPSMLLDHILLPRSNTKHTGPSAKEAFLQTYVNAYLDSSEKNDFALARNIMIRPLFPSVSYRDLEHFPGAEVYMTGLYQHTKRPAFTLDSMLKCIFDAWDVQSTWEGATKEVLKGHFTIGNRLNGFIYNEQVRKYQMGLSDDRQYALPGDYVAFIHDESACRYGVLRSHSLPLEYLPCCKPVTFRYRKDKIIGQIASTQLGMRYFEAMKGKQRIFKRKLFDRDGRCMVTGFTNLPPHKSREQGFLLTAGHIIPKGLPQLWTESIKSSILRQRGDTTEETEVSVWCVENGILLRKDLETMLDHHYWSVDPLTMKIVVFNPIDSLLPFHGQDIRKYVSDEHRRFFPTAEVWEEHYNQALLKAMRAQPHEDQLAKFPILAHDAQQLHERQSETVIPSQPSDTATDLPSLEQISMPVKQPEYTPPEPAPAVETFPASKILAQLAANPFRQQMVKVFTEARDIRFTLEEYSEQLTNSERNRLEITIAEYEQRKTDLELQHQKRMSELAQMHQQRMAALKVEEENSRIQHERRVLELESLEEKKKAKLKEQSLELKKKQFEMEDELSGHRQMMQEESYKFVLARMKAAEQNTTFLTEKVVRRVMQDIGMDLEKEGPLNLNDNNSPYLKEVFKKLEVLRKEASKVQQLEKEVQWWVQRDRQVPEVQTTTNSQQNPPDLIQFPPASSKTKTAPTSGVMSLLKNAIRKL